MSAADHSGSSARIPALDGIRGIAVMLIVWYHIWQQSWLMPFLRIPTGSGFRAVSLDFIPRTGFLFVDLMLLLSAFCLFLPHARAMTDGSPVPSPADFYRRRAARILPSYYLSVLVFFGFALAEGAYSNGSQALTDLSATATFTQMFRTGTYLGTHINGVLWTVSVEVLFYLVFPALAYCFRKKPLLTYVLMTAASAAYLRLFVLRNPDTVRVTLNQFAGFLGVFANGMASACLYTAAERRMRDVPDAVRTLLSVAGIAVSVYLVGLFQRGAANAQTVMVYQAQVRYVLSLTFSLLLVSASLGGKAVQAVLGNRVMYFFGAISYNLYIWHQQLAVRLKEARIPFWEGDTPPNTVPDRVWQHRYTLLCFTGAILLAALITFCFERPLNRRLLKKAAGRKE